jgi:electron transfer flavoprotein beta subunit
MSDGRPLTIAVCIKVSPDTAQLRADSRTGAPRLDDVPYRIGTFDENALEEATRLKEKHGGKVVAVSLTAGAPPPELILRALAMGADEAYVIEDPTAEHADSLATTRILSAALKKLEGWDLILCGEGSIDAYNRQVGPRLAEALEIPVLTYATRVEDRRGRAASASHGGTGDQRTEVPDRPADHGGVQETHREVDTFRPRISRGGNRSGDVRCQDSRGLRSA